MPALPRVLLQRLLRPGLDGSSRRRSERSLCPAVHAHPPHRTHCVWWATTRPARLPKPMRLSRVRPSVCRYFITGAWLQCGARMEARTSSSWTGDAVWSPLPVRHEASKLRGCHSCNASGARVPSLLARLNPGQACGPTSRCFRSRWSGATTRARRSGNGVAASQRALLPRRRLQSCWKRRATSP